MLCSCDGSSRASTAVLSQIEPTPGAVIAAHAVPEDCGRLPPLASSPTAIATPSASAAAGSRSCRRRPWCRGNSTAAVLRLPRRSRWPCRSTTTTSRCWMPTAAPRAPSTPDLPFNVDASTLSWLQSSSRSLIERPWSWRLGLGVLDRRPARRRHRPRARLPPAARSLRRANRPDGEGGVCACAGGTGARPVKQSRPPESAARPARIVVLEIIAQPACLAPDMRANPREIVAGRQAGRDARSLTRCRRDHDAILGRWIGRPSACSTRSKVSTRMRMLDSRPALNLAKCASRRLIGLLESSAVSE